MGGCFRFLTFLSSVSDGKATVTPLLPGTKIVTSDAKIFPSKTCPLRCEQFSLQKLYLKEVLYALYVFD